jgi:hypothetical protein
MREGKAGPLRKCLETVTQRGSEYKQGWGAVHEGARSAEHRHVAARAAPPSYLAAILASDCEHRDGRAAE